MAKGIKKGIILAGGLGSRLYPVTQVTSKQLLPVYDKPMIYYPLTMLMYAGVNNILLISTPTDIPRFEALLGDGSQWGINISYKEQPKPEGLAQAFILGKEFIGDDSVALILGDNIFYGSSRIASIFKEFESGGQVFGYAVTDPERYGVIQFDKDGKAISIEEKPTEPKSNYAVPGLYLFDNRVSSVAEGLKPSPRGELEIVDVIKHYLERGELMVETLGRGFAWLDTGLATTLQEAGSFMRIIEKRQGVKIGCPEEIALLKGYIDLNEFEGLIKSLPQCDYRKYLETVFKEYNEGHTRKIDLY